jgi:hypothetical protein
MSNFRFSPIRSEAVMLQALEYIHIQSFRLCKENIGRILPVAGNIGIFCHFQDEFEYLTGLRKERTESRNWNNKYFKLHKPIVIKSHEYIPETTYTYLYIRRPEVEHTHVGDADFYLPPAQYEALKAEVKRGVYGTGVTMFERPDLDLVRLSDPKVDVSAFIGSYDLEKITT